jgi:hypothetical protein
MTGAIFMPRFFQAHSGVVHFLGRPLSDFTATRARVALLKASIDAPVGSRLEAAFADAKEQAEKAIAQARRQSTTPTPERAAS